MMVSAATSAQRGDAFQHLPEFGPGGFQVVPVEPVHKIEALLNQLLCLVDGVSPRSRLDLPFRTSSTAFRTAA